MNSTHQVLPPFFHPLNFTAYACGLEKPTLRPEWAHLGDAKMNVENILKVADAIEKHSIPDLGFNMAMWRQSASDNAPDRSGHKCGTTACVAGWACAVLLDDLDAVDALGMSEMGQRFFGLDYNQSFALFIAQGRSETDLADVPQGQAIRTLRHLAATGQVDWTA